MVPIGTNHDLINTVAVIGNYLPRQCGIATFTTDLVEALSARDSSIQYWTMVMNDRPEGYPYPEKVHFEINQNRLADYQMAAEFLNINQVDIVCLQHEYGIFGGPAGGHILKLLAELRMPVVTTLHTVLADPDKEYRAVMNRLAGLSEKLVVMSHKAVEILGDVYAVPEEKITFIHHGIPDLPFVDPNYYKDLFGVLGKKALLTFGLLSQNKGIEYVLQALPEVIARHPGVAYIVLGATHPHVLREEGESYRIGLQQLVAKLGLQQHVIFQNRFVTQEELGKYLAAADLYITPYTSEAQITSGTLAYAMGTGKAVISTPYWYAGEMLAGGRGRLVPFRDPQALTAAIIDLLDDDAERHVLRKNAYDFCREMVWEKVAGKYLNVFNEVKHERAWKPSPHKPSPRHEREAVTSVELPELKLDHLRTLTDDTGLLQHAKYTIAERNHGYCTDDNARALIVATRVRHLLPGHTTALDDLCNRYLAFLLHAFNPDNGRLRNFMNYDRRWLEAAGSEDAHGRALWGLGTAVPLLDRAVQQPLALQLFKRALPAAAVFNSPRAVALSLMGIHAYLEVFSGDSETRRISERLTGRLFGQFASHASDSWPWPEDIVTYANGKLPHALLLAGQWMQRDDMTAMGLRALNWLLQIQTEDGHLVPIGNGGWYTKGGHKARFDQQPLEAQSLIEASIEAFRLTGEQHWIDQAKMCFSWFLGQNDLRLPLYDAGTGGCRDGLQSGGVNQNEGAESTLAWLLSLTALQRLSAEEVLQQTLHHAGIPAASTSGH